MFLGPLSMGICLVVLPIFGYIHVLELEDGQRTARGIVSLVRLMWLLITSANITLPKIRAMRHEIAKTIQAIAREEYSNRMILPTTPIASRGIENGAREQLKVFTDK